MAYVQKSSSAATAPRSTYAGNKPAGVPQKPKAEGDNRPTHSLSAKVGEGDSVEFINLTGLFAGQTKDGRAMFKGKPNKVEVIIRLEDGRELKADSLIVTAKN